MQGVTFCDKLNQAVFMSYGVFVLYGVFVYLCICVFVYLCICVYIGSWLSPDKEEYRRSATGGPLATASVKQSSLKRELLK